MFIIPVLSKTEEDIVIECLSNPSVKKYLSIMAMSDTKELLALSAISTPDSELIKAHATVNGKLAVISTLFSITSTQTKE